MCFLLYLYGNFSLTSLPIMPAFLSLERPLAFRIREAMLYIVLHHSESSLIGEGFLKG